MKQRTNVPFTENREKLEELAQLLLEKEVIFKEDLERILGVRPYIDRQTQIDEAETSAQLAKDSLIAENAINESTSEATEISPSVTEELKGENSVNHTETPETEES